MKISLSSLAVVLVATILVGPAAAQWSPDHAMNLSVGFGPGDQVVPQTAVVPAGGSFAEFMYVGWYDNASGNYDLGLQLLAPDGVPVFPAGGIIVSDQPQDTWVMDWSLAADNEGNAYVTFADLRDGTSNIHVYKIGPDGSFPWGPDGISLTHDSDFKGPPCVTVASDGQAVVVWMQSGAGTVLRMQRLAADGTQLLAAGGVVVSEASDMAPAGNLLVPTFDGDVILGYIPRFLYPGLRQLKAQRFDASGQAVWPAAVMVMDDASIPPGRFFELTPDGLGGALFYCNIEAGALFDVRLQRLDADGVEMLPHNGVYPEAGGPASQHQPSAVYDPATDTYVLAYIDMSSLQYARGLSAQRFDSSGNRLWGEGGKVLMPQDGDFEMEPSLVLAGGAVLGVVQQAPAGAFGQDPIFGFRLDDAGDFMWGGLVDVASTPSAKGNLQAVFNGQTMVAVWEDSREGAPDIYAQNLNADGSLGPSVVAIDTIDEPTSLPTAFAAQPNYPNPFNPRTTIAFDLPRAQAVTLRVYDASGALVRVLVDGVLSADHHAIDWDGTDQAGRRQPSGVYFYQLVTAEREVTRAMTMVK